MVVIDEFLTVCDPSLTRANLSALEMSIAHTIKRYTKCPAYFTLLYVSIDQQM